MAGKKYKSRAIRLGEALNLIEQGLSGIDELADEMESWRDNISGTNLESTQKYQDVEECADILRQAADDIESAKGDLDSVNFPGMFG